MKAKPTSDVWLLAGLFLLGFGLRCIHLDFRSVSLDESYTLALLRSGFGVMLQSTVNDIHPPLFYAVLMGWAHLAGPSLAMARILTTLFSALLIPVVFYFTRSCLGRRSAWWAAALAAASPYFMELGRWARMPSLMTLLSALSLYFFWQAFRKPEKISWFVAYSVVSLAAIYTHYFGILALLCPYVFLFLLYQRRERDWMASLFFRRWLASQAVLFLGMLPWLSVFEQHFTRKMSPYGSPQAFHTWDPLRLYYYFLVGSYNWENWSKILAALFLGVTGVILVKYAWPLRRSLFDALKKPAGLFLAVILFLPVLLAALYSLIGTNVVDRRYLAFAAIPLLMLLASLLARIPARASVGAAGLLLAAFLPPLQNQWFQYGPVDNWRQVADLVRSHRMAGDVLLVHPNFYKLPLQCYLTGVLPMIALPKEFDAMNLEMEDPPALTLRELAGRQTAIRGCRRVWLVAGRYNRRDSALVRRWLTGIYGRPQTFDFPSARVYLFAKPAPARAADPG